MKSSSSSLTFSDSKFRIDRHKGGLFKNLPFRKSKQEMHENKMFGSKKGKHGKDFMIGKKFRGKGKGIMKAGSMKSGGISPSVEEFDDMMDSVSGNKGRKKKTMFSGRD